MARYVARRLLLAHRHAVAARHDRVRDRQRAARRRRSDDPRAVRAAGERRRAQRAARHQPSAARPVRATRIAGHRHARLRRLVRVRPAGAAADPRGGRCARRSWPSWRCSSPSRSPSPPASVRRPATGPQGRPGDRPARRHASSIPEFVTGTMLVVVVGVQLGWLPVLATPPPDADIVDADPLPADAGDGDGDRLLRLHRPDDAGRRDRGPPVRLHANGDDEGPDRPAR